MHSDFLPIRVNNSFENEDIPPLMRVVDMVKSEIGLTPVMATEIEFYLDGISKHSFKDAVLHDINSALVDSGITAMPVEEERGSGQYEVALHHSHDIEKIVKDSYHLKSVICSTVEPHEIKADFSAKPFADMPGSGLHVHVHLIDSNGDNVFSRDEDVYSPLLRQSIAGMLALMQESMPIFAPFANAYMRYQPNSGAPVNVSWGPNNRTVAVRLPDKPLNHKHIEHRVAGADAPPALVMLAVLAGVHYGIVNELILYDGIYGNAWETHYDLYPLPPTLEGAVEHMKSSSVLPKYMGKEIMDNFLRRVLYPDAF